MRRWLAAGLMAVIGAVAHGQAPAGQDHAMQVVKDADLHLTFSYPADLEPMDAKALADATSNSRFGEDSGENTDTVQPEACAKVLLSVGQVTEGNNGKIWGILTMLDVGPACIPPKALKSTRAMDTLLKPLVTGGTQVLGMMPLGGGATSYLIQGHKMHFAGAQGQPVAKSDLQTTDQSQTIAHMAVAIDGHIVMWRVESNNAGLLNRMLASQVDFGAGPPQPLFPGRLKNDLQF